MHTVYILYSMKIDQYYTGHTDDLNDRLTRHNHGKSLGTKRGVPWELKWTLPCKTRSKAMQVEGWIKKMKSRSIIEAIIRGDIDVADKFNVKE
jgi:putative endonuclease